MNTLTVLSIHISASGTGLINSPDRFILQLTQKSPMHHRLQCQGNEPCFPVFYVLVITELHEDSLFSGRSGMA